MFGLIVFSIWGAYIALSVFVIYRARRYALENCKTMSGAWALTFVAAFIMFLIPGWDYIPTMAMHSYYCRTESGIFFDKDFEVWKKENPGVLEGLVEVDNAALNNEISNDGKKRKTSYRLNQRFHYIRESDDTSVFLPVLKTQTYYVDSKTNEEMMHDVNFSTGKFVERGKYDDIKRILKMWMYKRSCDGYGNVPYEATMPKKDVQKFSSIETQIKGAEK